MKITKIKELHGVSSIVLELSEDEASTLQWMAEYVNDSAWDDEELDNNGVILDDVQRAAAEHVDFLRRGL